MRLSFPSCLAGVLACVLVACGPAAQPDPTPPKPICEAGETRACYTGGDDTRGVGACADGVETCRDGKWPGVCDGEVLPAVEVCDGVDNDCDGRTDEGLKNACGGCGELDAQPGESCEGCGTAACDGTESIVCEMPSPGPGESCLAANGCDGAYACGQDGLVACMPTALKNSCGVCGGNPIGDLGATCVSAEGCNGQRLCTADGEGTECVAPAKNSCGVCGGPAIAGLGDACTANGCGGTLVCDSTGTGTRCNAPVQNACGVCGGPDFGGKRPGDSCTTAQGCSGTLACDGTGTGLVCNGPAKNACGVCGGPDLGADKPGDPCSSDEGCNGTLACNGDGTGYVCSAPVKNACGLCGGPALVGLGDACQNDGCSPGVLVCSDAKNALVCNGPAKNNCGVCGEADVQGLGGACTYGDGSASCSSRMVCDAAGTGAVCEPVVQNNCGECGQPDRDLGTTCNAANGCDGVRACAPGGGTMCVPVTQPNECGLCSGASVPDVGAGCVDPGSSCQSTRVCTATRDGTQCVPVAGVGGACTTANGCESEIVCNPSGPGAVCEPVPKNQCGVCGGVDVPEVGGSCMNAAGNCSGKWVCNGTGDGAVCNAPETCVQKVVISEIVGEGKTWADDEFIELYNPNPYEVSLNGLALYYRAKGGASWNQLVTFNSGDTMKPWGFFLVGHTGYRKASYPDTPDADRTYTTQLSTSDGTVLLWKTGAAPSTNNTTLRAHENFIDMAGWGSPSSYEGTAATAPAKGKSIERKASSGSTAASMKVGGADALLGNGHDTDNNKNDFLLRDAPMPQNSKSAPEPPTAP